MTRRMAMNPTRRSFGLCLVFLVCSLQSGHQMFDLAKKFDNYYADRDETRALRLDYNDNGSQKEGYDTDLSINDDPQRNQLLVVPTNESDMYTQDRQLLVQASSTLSDNATHIGGEFNMSLCTSFADEIENNPIILSSPEDFATLLEDDDDEAEEEGGDEEEGEREEFGEEEDLSRKEAKLRGYNCAIVLYGLPRAFKDLVLPSLRANVLGPNAPYRCDYFVHYYDQAGEGPGRRNRGGTINPRDILLLQEEVERVHQNLTTTTRINNKDTTTANATSSTGTGTSDFVSSFASYVRSLFGEPNEEAEEAEEAEARRTNTPTVQFISDTEEDFFVKNHRTVEEVRNTLDEYGEYLYFPYVKGLLYAYPTSIDNIIKMWHSIQEAHNLMKRYGATHNIQYDRVAMLRNDVFYVTPIDIYDIGNDQTKDYNNEYTVIPGFGRHPVNDRMVYGPAGAVEVWATHRFLRKDAYARALSADCELRGYGLQSERFVKHVLLAEITNRVGSVVVEHDAVCFLRARADSSLMYQDCGSKADIRKNRTNPLITQNVRVSTRVSEIVGRECAVVKREQPGIIDRVLKCFNRKNTTKTDAQSSKTTASDSTKKDKKSTKKSTSDATKKDKKSKKRRSDASQKDKKSKETNSDAAATNKSGTKSSKTKSDATQTDAKSKKRRKADTAEEDAKSMETSVS